MSYSADYWNARRQREEEEEAKRVCSGVPRQQFKTTLEEMMNELFLWKGRMAVLEDLLKKRQMEEEEQAKQVCRIQLSPKAYDKICMCIKKQCPAPVKENIQYGPDSFISGTKKEDLDEAVETRSRFGLTPRGFSAVNDCIKKQAKRKATPDSQVPSSDPAIVNEAQQLCANSMKKVSRRALQDISACLCNSPSPTRSEVPFSSAADIAEASAVCKGVVSRDHSLLERDLSKFLTKSSVTSPSPVVEAPAMPSFEENMRKLKELGFLNFEQNVKALIQSKNNVRIAINSLLTDLAATY